MFRKYYKEANNDIKADEEFINRVIEKTRKKRVSSVKYYRKYALTAAAAVIILSVTAVTLPRMTDHNDDGVISIVTETAQPTPSGVTTPPTVPAVQTAAPNPPEKKTITGVKKKPAESKTEQTKVKDTDIIKEDVVENIKEDTMEDTVETARNMAAEKKADAGTTGESDEIGTDKAASIFSSAFSGAAPALGIGGEETAVTADKIGGGDITVTVEETDEADSPPVYDEQDGVITAVFVSSGSRVTVRAVGADMSEVEEIVANFR